MCPPGDGEAQAGVAEAADNGEGREGRRRVTAGKDGAMEEARQSREHQKYF